LVAGWLLLVAYFWFKENVIQKESFLISSKQFEL